MVVPGPENFLRNLVIGMLRTDGLHAVDKIQPRRGNGVQGGNPNLRRELRVHTLVQPDDVIDTGKTGFFQLLGRFLSEIPDVGDEQHIFRQKGLHLPPDFQEPLHRIVGSGHKEQSIDFMGGFPGDGQNLFFTFFHFFGKPVVGSSQGAEFAISRAGRIVQTNLQKHIALVPIGLPGHFVGLG